VLLVLPLTCAVAQGQAYPSKSIRLVIAQSAGSATDTVARIVGQKMGAELGQQIVIDLRPGAGGVTGSEIAARAAPDGYTLFASTISTHGTIPALYRRLSYDPIKDFTPIGLWVTIPNMLVVHPSLPVRNPQELIALARTRPGQLNVGYQGNGSSQHLATELFKLSAGNLNFVTVPYKGSGPAIIGLVTGEISFLFPTLALSRPQILAGRIRAIAVATAERVPEFPDLPTVNDTVPGFVISSWSGIHAPAGTPREIIARLAEVSARAVEAPDVKKLLVASGMNASPSTPSEYGSFVEREIARWTKVARAAKIEAD
jgi:tripartite-type tricarboxylate transporter receptor subunit TctC